MSLCSFTEKFELNAPIDRVFCHFTDTEKMGGFFPPSLRMRVVRRTARQLSHGNSIDFEVRLFCFPLRWKSYVHSFNPNRHIAYIMQGGLLDSWEHDQYFESISGNQTRITECLLYHPPMGVIGKLANRLWIGPCLRRLFSFRHTGLISFFQTST